MTRHTEMTAFLTGCMCLMMSAAGQIPSATKDVTAYMDRREIQAGQYGCGDTIRDTITGEVSSVIPVHDPNLNCTLTLYSPPGTRLSLTVNSIRLVSHNLNTCDGNRLKILGSDVEGATSLLPSFPNGLCGYAKPSQSIESTGNRVYLLLETVESTVENLFTLSYTSFKTSLDGDCFACDVGDSRELPFCIDRSLLCDDVQNCPGNTEETSQNCQVTLPPTGSGNTTVIIVVCVLVVVLIAVIIFIILTLLAKRTQSKRNRDSARRPERVSQSGMVATDLAVNLSREHHPRMYTDVPGHHGVPGPAIHHHRDAPPTFTVEYESGSVQLGDLPGAGPLPWAPPPYSTLPRNMEQSLQMAENTNPTSRSRLASADNEVAPGTP